MDIEGDGTSVEAPVEVGSMGGVVGASGGPVGAAEVISGTETLTLVVPGAEGTGAEGTGAEEAGPEGAGPEVAGLEGVGPGAG